MGTIDKYLQFTTSTILIQYNKLGLGDCWDYENNHDVFCIIVMLMLLPYNRDVAFKFIMLS